MPLVPPPSPATFRCELERTTTAGIKLSLALLSNNIKQPPQSGYFSMHSSATNKSRALMGTSSNTHHGADIRPVWRGTLPHLDCIHSSPTPACRSHLPYDAPSSDVQSAQASTLFRVTFTTSLQIFERSWKSINLA